MITRAESNPCTLRYTEILKISTCDIINKINRLKVYRVGTTHYLKINHLEIKFYEINCFKIERSKMDY